ncbi:ArsR/SmtB family transcription factor [Enterococcus dongliensis]|uniref:ArsR/SmtB family transcription factor n=1 Tax=Enterococcus dongliensis TaxID=2559925 RepID=UPI0028906D23|nr:metalloregulator ArsR/SmtB family transcription factor [Enterococcus dongliensis]MDT2673771.1 metalloregulator ArsR/SmtB family transcription factor [Enterococcus dongliensis]
MHDLKQLQNRFSEASDFLLALGDEKRQAIIIALLEDPACKGLRVTELTEATNLSRPAVSHHLKILKQAKLINYRSEGTKNYYYLSHDTTEIDKLKDVLTLVSTIIATTDHSE